MPSSSTDTISGDWPDCEIPTTSAPFRFEPVIVTVVKEAMMLLGLPVGPPRVPGLPALDAADRDRLHGVLTDWGLKPLPVSVAAK